MSEAEEKAEGLSLAYLYHPRGFRRTVGAEAEDLGYWENESASRKLGIPAMVTHNGNDKINELKHDWDRKANFAHDWVFISQALSLAGQTIPSMFQLIEVQRDNRRVRDHNWQFLFDVCQFINTGRCEMLPMNRLELMEDEPAARAINTERTRPEIYVADRKSRYLHQKPITQMLSHEGGLEFLVDTLYILFGGPVK